MIVVTGGTGLVGAHLLFDLCRKYEQVRAIKRTNSDLSWVKKTFSFYSADAEKLFQKIEWMDADLNDYFSLEKAFQGAKQVYHAAAMVSFHPVDNEQMLEANVQGTANVVNAALFQQVEKLCYVSSIAALGRADENQKATEQTPWKDSAKSSLYSISKYKAELEVWRGVEEGLKVVIVNPAVILGPAKWNSGSASLFSLVWKGLKFYTAGTNGYVYVRDVSRAMIELTESPISAERFTLSAEDVSYRKLFSLMAENLHKPTPRIAVKPWMSELSWRLAAVRDFLSGNKSAYSKETARSSMKMSRYSNQKIKEALNFEFTSIEETVEQTAQLFLLDHIKTNAKK